MLYQLGKGVYQYYRDNIYGNQYVSYELAQRKLTRNIMLAAKFEENYYVYGHLHIITNGNKIIQLINGVKSGKWFYKSPKQYERLNRILKIEELEKRDRKAYFNLSEENKELGIAQ